MLLAIFASIFLWLAYNASLSSAKRAYHLAQASQDFAVSEYKCKNASNEEKQDFCDFSAARQYKDQLVSTQVNQMLEFILLFISQIFILVLLWLSIKKPNKFKNENASKAGTDAA